MKFEELAARKDCDAIMEEAAEHARRRGWEVRNVGIRWYVTVPGGSETVYVESKFWEIVRDVLGFKVPGEAPPAPPVEDSLDFGGAL